ncbi:MAG: DNA replication/repair protein RecF [Lachnospiraceae bacterium]|nr:DNA replication/repair protein RecF [Lachnospiraceae bacterium]
MVIKSLKLNNYRNYENLDIEFDSGTTILYGDNAQGKTNILEAIYVSATTKSHRSSKDREIIRFDHDEAHIKTFVEKKEIDHKVDIHLKKNKTKGIAIDGIPIRKSAELFGIANVILFSPEDLSIIKNGPSERRRFLDLELCQLDKLYLYNYTNYNQVLNKRNNLLKQIYYNPSLTSTLDVWDYQLAKYGTEIIRTREAFIEKLNNMLYSIHKKLTGSTEELRIEYEKSVDENEYIEQLQAKRDMDLKYQSTQIGPQRDDMNFYINDIEVRRFGSQGQQRTAALSLKLAEIEIVKELIHDTPILLLDDVMSELDENRRDYLLQSIHDIQTIITCTGYDDYIKRRMTINRVYRVRQGHVYQESSFDHNDP